ncbi:odorant receptor 4 [Tribolium castaneum]|uniref:Odorant receptor n=1 Tax=Tribolium castaneum TaxID=7070 RepID=D6WBE1_TRICA|nr:PREDICTED: odorant receptor 4-like [Tribolium castaneum]EEZ99303.1 odorant receptor 49 [Tribolium castaneum]|eukprot:XP_015840815.1 PREDICTED: odorant receptor 4-like [Tribolium castaneum]
MVVEKINLREPFENVTRLLKILGCWYFPNESLVYKMYKNFALITCCMYTVTSIIYSFKYMSIDYDKAYESLEIGVGTAEGVLKGIIFRMKFQKITESWQQIQQPEFQPRNEKQKMLLRRYIYVTKFLFKVYFFVVYIVCVTGLIVSSLLRHKDLPTDHWLPFDYRKPFLHQYIYLHLTAGLYLNSLTNCAVDSCFYLSLLHITAQCDVLADTLKNIHDLDKLNAKNAPERENKDQVMNKILVECMKHFNLIKKFTNQITDCFKEILTLQFVPTVAMICMGMYKISTLQASSSQFWFFVCTDLGATTQIFIYCFVGNLVTTTSEKLFYATFKSQWYNASQKFKKNLLTFMMAVQHPIIFYGWDVFAINYETFKSIMRTSWSICVALKSTQDL